ncbi:hypothetical protein [Streptomyces virginiae]|uniref:hypothetical protein n=1 Tax=Streptomyces virginiae TaxID=1961 RepID=UPI003AF3C0F0
MELNLRRGSRHEQEEAEICRVEVGEVAGALGPPAGGEVVVWGRATHTPGSAIPERSDHLKYHSVGSS